MSASIDTVFRKVHAETCKLIRELFGPFRDGLQAMGAGPRGNINDFREGLNKAVETLLFTPLDEPPYKGMTITGATEKRTAVMTEFFVGLGVNEDTAGRYGQTLASVRKNYLPDGTRLPPTAQRNMGSLHTTMRHWTGLIYMAARKTYSQLEEINRDAARAYEGTPSDPDDGVEQVADLISRFPGLADRIYDAVGFRGLMRYPPESQQPPTGDEAIFVNAIQDHIDGEWWSTVLFAGGLAIVAIAITAVSFGTLGPVAAAAIGAGLGTAQGGYVVYDRTQALAEARVAATVGAIDPATLRQMERSLQGAWAMLAVDAVTGGILGKFGGTTLASTVIRGTLISGAGGGVGTAVDPNVWHSPNRAALIMQGFVVGAVAGGAGSVAGAAFMRTLRPGSQVQIALERGGGPLTPGRKVRVSATPDAEPTTAKVTAVDENTGTVTIEVEGQTASVRVNKTVEVEAPAGAVAAARGTSTGPTARVGDSPPIPPDGHYGGYHGTAVPSGADPHAVIRETFNNGLPARGGNMDLNRHARELDAGAADFDQRSAFRGTTQMPASPDGSSGAAVWADEGGVVYQIDGVPTWDVNRALEGRVKNPDGTFGGNLMHGEQEHAILSGVPTHRIMRAGVVETNRNGIQYVRTWVPNPNYAPR